MVGLLWDQKIVLRQFDVFLPTIAVKCGICMVCKDMPMLAARAVWRRYVECHYMHFRLGEGDEFRPMKYLGQDADRTWYMSIGLAEDYASEAESPDAVILRCVTKDECLPLVCLTLKLKEIQTI